MACAQATLEEVTEADLLLHVLDASSPQVLEQRQAVLGVLRGLGVSQQRLQEDVIEVWNKIDMLPTGSSGGSGEALEEQPAGRQQEAGMAVAAAAGAASSGGSSEETEEAANSRGAMPESSGLQEAADAEADAAGGGLPPAVAALLEAGSGCRGADAGHRPTALATSVVQGRGLQEVLAAVESKVSSCWGPALVAVHGCGYFAEMRFGL